MFKPDYIHKTDNCFSFGADVSARANVCLDNESIKSFWKGFCCQAGEVNITPCEEMIFSVGEVQIPSLDGNQYAVNIEKTGLCVVGNNKKGLINGFMTLLHQIKANRVTDKESVFEIACGEFKEKPLLQNQMVHFCIFPETELWELEKFIRFSAALKYTHIVIEFWGMLKYDCLKELGWKQAYSKEEIRPLIKMANELGLEVIPMFNHWGHASASRVIHGKHVVLDQNPKLQPLFSDDGWIWNLENPDTLELLRNVRNELIELCGDGKYFHLGCDEAYNIGIKEDNYSILTDYLNGISDELAASGRRPIVWGDMLIAKHDEFNKNNRYTVGCENPELENLILSALSRNIIIADWQYNVSEAPVETALIFKDAGFDTLLCPWDSAFGNRSIIPCINTATDADLFGVMHTTWNTLSFGMSDVSKAAYCSWTDCRTENNPPLTYFMTNSSAIIRKVYPVYGDYEKAGWTKKQISMVVK